MKKRIITIVGPTASGKSDLAYSIAHTLPSSIINADSVQIYKGLDIISGKDVFSQMPFYSLPSVLTPRFHFGYFLHNNVPYYLYDVVKPNTEFSVHAFCTLVHEAINYSIADGRCPLIVGGTVFYLKVLLDGIDTLSIPPNEVLRKRLSVKNVDELQNELQMRDDNHLTHMNNSDRNNKRRLIRAIEINEFKKDGKNVIKIEGLYKNYDVIEIGINISREDLKKRIDKRINLRLQNGALNEAQKLYRRYDMLTPIIKETTGYKELFEYLHGDIDLGDAIQKWREAEYLVAKHQMTFLKKRKSIQWFDRNSRTFETDIKRFISL